jgi:hypothetical protein
MKTLLALLASAFLVAAAAAPVRGATLEAVGGLGGVAKAGRWTPLVVSIGGEREALDAELAVAWGDSHLHRPVTLSPGTRKQFELYVRTGDPRAAIEVRLLVGGREIARTSAPVRVLGADDRVIVCVSADTTASLDAGECTAAVLTRALPRSPRGYEVADDVRWPGAVTGLTREQDAALRAWRALEALDASGDLGATPQISRPLIPRGLPATIAPIVAAIGAAYLIALIAAGVALRARRARLSGTIAAFAVVTAGACAAVAAIGRVGTTRAVHLHHVSLLQQLPGAQASVLTTRAIAEFPAFDRFALRLPVADGVLETTSPRGAASGALDAEGFPVVSGVFGIAGRQAFAGEALVEARPLALEERGRAIAIQNQSGQVLRDCRLGRGLSASAAVGTLAPGARIEAYWTSGSDEAPTGPVITCTADEAPLPFSEAQRPVVMHGSTTIAAYRSTAARGGAGD